MKKTDRFADKYSVVKACIDAWDPYALLAGGAPEDEFREEARAVALRIAPGMTQGEIASIVSELFLQAFEPELFGVEDCEEVAGRIFRGLTVLRKENFDHLQADD